MPTKVVKVGDVRAKECLIERKPAREGERVKQRDITTQKPSSRQDEADRQREKMAKVAVFSFNV